MTTTHMSGLIRTLNEYQTATCTVAAGNTTVTVDGETHTFNTLAQAIEWVRNEIAEWESAAEFAAEARAEAWAENAWLRHAEMGRWDPEDERERWLESLG